MKYSEGKLDLFHSKKMLENLKVHLRKTLMITIIRVSSTDTFDSFIIRY